MPQKLFKELDEHSNFFFVLLLKLSPFSFFFITLQSYLLRSYFLIVSLYAVIFIFSISSDHY